MRIRTKISLATVSVVILLGMLIFWFIRIEYIIAKTTNIIFFLTLLMILLSGIVIFLVNRLVTNPLEKLSSAVSKISLWNLEQRIEIDSKDEIGKLAQSINQMADQLQTSYTEVEESETKYRSLMKDANDAIFVHTLEGKILDVNSKAQELTGFSGEELRNKAMQQLCPESELETIEKQLKKVDRTGTVHFETRLLTKDKKTVEVDISASRVSYGGHKVIQEIVRDITERRRAEEMLKESEEKFRNLAEHSPNMIFINKKGRIVYANNKCEEVMGYQRKELCSPDFDFLSLIAPEFRDVMKESFRKHMSGEEIPPIDYVIVTKGGKRIEALYISKLIRYEGEKAILGVVTDITERKQAEEALRESEETARALLNAPTDHIALIDRKGMIFALNTTMKKRLLGILKSHEGLRKRIGGPGQLIGSCIYDFFPGEPGRLRKAQTAKVFRTGEPIRFEETRAGTWFDTVVYPVLGKDGKVEKAAVIARDVTDIKKAQEEVKRKAEDLALINLINEAINQGKSFQEIVNLLCEETKRIFSSTGATVYLLSEDGKYLTVQNLTLTSAMKKQIEKIIDRKMPELRVRLKKGSLYLKVLQSGKPQLLNDPNAIRHLMAEYTESKTIKRLIPAIHKLLGIQSVMSVPLISDGKVLGLMDTSRAELFTESDLERFHSFSAEITTAIKRKMTEDALQWERDFTSRVVETSPAATTVVDSDGKIIFANAAAEKVLGLKKNRITQRTYNDPEWRITNYDGRPFPDKDLPFRRVMKTGKPVYNVRHAIEWPDGRRILLLINATPIFDASGQVDGMVAMIQNVTDQMQGKSS